MQLRLLLSALLLLSTVDTEAVCKRCQDLREYHRAHPENNYEFYEDYLKDQAQHSPADSVEPSNQ